MIRTAFRPRYGASGRIFFPTAIVFRMRCVVLRMDVMARGFSLSPSPTPSHPPSPPLSVVHTQRQARCLHHYGSPNILIKQ